MRKTALVLAVLTLSGMVAGVAPSSARTSATACGTWRWPVKTLSDKNASKVTFQPVKVGVDGLRSFSRPTNVNGSTPRVKPMEFVTARVYHVALIEAKMMPDHDVYLVIAEPAHHARTMVVEFPDTSCKGAARSVKKAKMQRARDSVLSTCPALSGSHFTKLKGKATITGVAFWDQVPGEAGAAPNGIELHPVLRFFGTCSKV